MSLPGGSSGQRGATAKISSCSETSCVAGSRLFAGLRRREPTGTRARPSRAGRTSARRRRRLARAAGIPRSGSAAWAFAARPQGSLHRVSVRHSGILAAARASRSGAPDASKTRADTGLDRRARATHSMEGRHGRPESARAPRSSLTGSRSSGRLRTREGTPSSSQPRPALGHRFELGR